MPVRKEEDEEMGRVFQLTEEQTHQLAEMRTQLQVQIDDLWETHKLRFMRFLGEAEVEKINLSFRATLDFTASKAGIEVTMGYSQQVKDKRRSEIDPQEQGQLPGTTRDELKAGIAGEAQPLPEGGAGPVEEHKERAAKPKGTKRGKAKTADVVGATP